MDNLCLKDVIYGDSNPIVSIEAASGNSFIYPKVTQFTIP